MCDCQCLPFPQLSKIRKYLRIQKVLAKQDKIKCSVIVGVLLCNKSLFIILSLGRGIEKCKRTENSNLNRKYCVILKNKVLISNFHLPLLFNNTFYFRLYLYI